MDGITSGITFAHMALVQIPTKISKLVIDEIEKDIRGNVFPNRNKAINEILKMYYKVPSEFKITKKEKKHKS